MSPPPTVVTGHSPRISSPPSDMIIALSHLLVSRRGIFVRGPLWYSSLCGPVTFIGIGITIKSTLSYLLSWEGSLLSFLICDLILSLARPLIFTLIPDFCFLICPQEL